MRECFQVLGTLAQQKRRSTSLLRALAFNLSGAPQTLDIKQCGDVLFSVATLNFYDYNLLEKVCADVCNGLTVDLKKSAAVGSILTSLGLLRFKEIGNKLLIYFSRECIIKFYFKATMDKLSGWFLKNYDICRPQDIFALFQTSAVLNYQSPALNDIYKVREFISFN